MAEDVKIKIERAFPALSFQNQPLFLTYAPDSSKRLFVVEQVGKILVFPASNEVKAEQIKVFLDVTSIVKTAHPEQGLLGLAFSPDYAINKEFFISYTRGDGALVVARLKSSNSNSDAADISSLKEVLVVSKRQSFPNHNGGMIAFGPDKMLYIGTGDGGGGGDPQGNAQDLTQLLGKILRIDPLSKHPYAIPKDNPFIKDKKSRGEIWAYGLRNPWRFSFDRSNGNLWAGDVGQNKIEEINIIKKGGNYGWNLFEGTQTFRNPKKISPKNFIAPVHQYTRDEGISVTGGYVYRGKAVPNLQGQYIFGDYGSGSIWAYPANIKLAEVPALSSFGEDEAGELYAISHAGQIWRFRK